MRESPTILFSFRVLLFLAVTFLGWSNSSVAETEQPFCRPDARFGLEGRIVELAERYFRVCGPKGAGFPYHLDSSVGTPLLAISAKSLLADQMEAETTAPKYLWGHMTFQAGSFDAAIANQKRSKVIAAESITFGEAQYFVYARPNIVEEVQGQIGKGNLPRVALFVFDRPDNSEIPSHFMTCNGDTTAMPRSKYHCNVYLKYRETNDLQIKHGLIWNPIFEGEPMDFERLPDLVQAVHKLFEASDVTDQLDALEGIPIVRVSE